MYYGNNFGNPMPGMQPTQVPNYNPYNFYNNYQQPQQQTQQPKINTNKIFVSGIEDVKMRMLDPNSDYIFFDNDKSMIYRKVVDGTGHFDVKAYDVIEHKEAEKTPAEAQSINPQDFVRKEEFEALQAKLNTLMNKIEQQSEVKPNDGVGL